MAVSISVVRVWTSGTAVEAGTYTGRMSVRFAHDAGCSLRSRYLILDTRYLMVRSPISSIKNLASSIEYQTLVNVHPVSSVLHHSEGPLSPSSTATSTQRLASS